MVDKALVCTIEDCDIAAETRGFCEKHYARLRRTGDPHRSHQGRRPGWEKPPSYRAAHARLAAARGRAADHLCGCGAAAAEWAYDHADPQQLWGLDHGRTVPYSADPEHYQPLCVPCHRGRDGAHAKARRVG